DSHELPSIRRVLAEYLGLNYDELRLKPNEMNKLGLTNSEALNLLHKLAVKIISRLLELKVTPDQLDSQLLIEILNDELKGLIGGDAYSRG
ncbi:MAG: hypothetical protein DRJ20_02825, partial [Candidatus Methanomethylicota archaeon]